MLEWLFGKKKKKNAHNFYRKVSLEACLAGRSRKDKVLLLRDLKSKNHYNPDIDFLYDAEDMADELILLYLLMEMSDVVREEGIGVYDNDTLTLGDIVDQAIAEAIIEDPIGSCGDNNICSDSDDYGDCE